MNEIVYFIPAVIILIATNNYNYIVMSQLGKK